MMEEDKYIIPIFIIVVAILSGIYILEYIRADKMCKSLNYTEATDNAGFKYIECDNTTQLVRVCDRNGVDKWGRRTYALDCVYVLNYH